MKQNTTFFSKPNKKYNIYTTNILQTDFNIWNTFSTFLRVFEPNVLGMIANETLGEIFPGFFSSSYSLFISFPSKTHL